MEQYIYTGGMASTNHKKTGIPQEQLQLLKKKTDLSPTIPCHAPRILLVEDNPIIQTVVSALLTNLNCKVDSAFNGSDAISLFNPLHDLVLLDIGLPDMDGFEVARFIRNQIPQMKKIPIPIIVSSTHDKNELQQKCTKMSINEIIDKLTTLDSVKCVLQTWLPPDKLKYIIPN